jgi:FtsP/CotA-like multicopper oxidase with cupredoxin domain
MSPSEIEVREGDRVTLRLTSEEPTEVHLHGYDLEVRAFASTLHDAPDRTG